MARYNGSLWCKSTTFLLSYHYHNFPTQHTHMDIKNIDSRKKQQDHLGIPTYFDSVLVHSLILFYYLYGSSSLAAVITRKMTVNAQGVCVCVLFCCWKRRRRKVFKRRFTKGVNLYTEGNSAVVIVLSRLLIRNKGTMVLIIC